MRKFKEFNSIEQKEIIEFALKNGFTVAQNKYNIWAEAIKYQANKEYREKIKEKNKEFHALNKNKEDYKVSRKKSLDKRAASGESYKKWREWYDLNKERSSNNSKRHRLENIEHYQKRSKERYLTKEKQELREKYKNDPIHKLKCNLRESLRRALKYGEINKESPSIMYLGCTIEELKTYLESMFKPGMNWDNHGRGEDKWHIDHIKPLDILKENKEELKNLCHYTNYQPLWEKENLTKNNKYDELSIDIPEKIRSNEWLLLKEKEGNYRSQPRYNKNILHFQKHFYEIERQLYTKQEVKEKLLNNRSLYLNKPKEDLTVLEILRGFKISGIHFGYSHFSPLWAKKFVEDYKPSLVYDPFGGWGHRMLGIASTNTPYIYNDVWKKSVKGVQEISKSLELNNVLFHNKDSAVFRPEENYDSIFTCPPYYNKEIYSSGEFESLEHFTNWWERCTAMFMKDSLKVIGICISPEYTEIISNPLLKQGYCFVNRQDLGTGTTSHLTKDITPIKDVLLVFRKN